MKKVYTYIISFLLGNIDYTEKKINSLLEILISAANILTYHKTYSLLSNCLSSIN